MEEGRQRIVYLNGQYVRETEATVSMYDRGFLFGDAGFDVTRTFRHRPFRLEEHLSRFFRTLHYLRIDPGIGSEEMKAIVVEVLERNLPLLEPDDDCMLWQVVTRGTAKPGVSAGEVRNPTVAIYCYPITWDYARYYDTGLRVATSATRRTPSQCLSPQAKIRNYVNHIISDLQVRSGDPDLYTIMIDEEGNLAEGIGSNVFVVRGGRLHTPRHAKVLGGISRQMVLDLAAVMGIPAEEADIPLYEAVNADEAFVTSTLYNLLPIGELNGYLIGSQVPGPITARLLEAWSDEVGLDVVEQARNRQRASGAAIHPS